MSCFFLLLAAYVLLPLLTLYVRKESLIRAELEVPVLTYASV